MKAGNQNSLTDFDDIWRKLLQRKVPKVEENYLIDYPINNNGLRKMSSPARYVGDQMVLDSRKPDHGTRRIPSPERIGADYFQNEIPMDIQVVITPEEDITVTESTIEWTRLHSSQGDTDAARQANKAIEPNGDRDTTGQFNENSSREAKEIRNTANDFIHEKEEPKRHPLPTIQMNDAWGNTTTDFPTASQRRRRISEPQVRSDRNKLETPHHREDQKFEELFQFRSSPKNRHRGSDTIPLRKISSPAMFDTRAIPKNDFDFPGGGSNNQSLNLPRTPNKTLSSANLSSSNTLSLPSVISNNSLSLPSSNQRSKTPRAIIEEAIVRRKGICSTNLSLKMKIPSKPGHVEPKDLIGSHSDHGMDCDCDFKSDGSELPMVVPASSAFEMVMGALKTTDF